jgi:predicted short-subunit dehydrogenase-like oxidoreductase (DUF2520 family)
MRKTVAIIGAGRTGSAIGFLLKQKGYTVSAVATRTPASAEQARKFIGAGIVTIDAAQAAETAEIIFITTPDGAIETVCNEIARAHALKPGSLVVHASGAHSLDLLNAAQKAGAYRAVIHLLQSVPSRELGVINIPGSYFRIEADPEAEATAKELVQAMGGIELLMPKWSKDGTSPALYHAGAVTVSNYFVALVDYGLRFYETLGADKQEALKALLPLIRATLKNIESVGIPAALTGPIARGDVETVRDHLEAMRKKAPQLLGLYCSLAQQALATAQQQGLQEAKAEELSKLIENLEKDETR